MKLVLWLAIAISATVSGCNRETPPPPLVPTNPIGSADDVVSFTALNRGQQLFQEHCAQCHGPDGQGHPDWQTPGVVAAPPLNGTGNDWKRTHAELMASIKKGVAKNGEMVMPAWKGRLTDADINAIIAWFQTVLWPPDVYAQWRRKTAAINPAS